MDRELKHDGNLRSSRTLSSTVAVALVAFLSSNLAFCDAVFAGTEPAKSERPNFLFLIADDVSRDDCGAFGNPHVGTPHLDRLAKQGMRFRRAFVTASSCSPSRCSILTGRYPHATGAYQLHAPLPCGQITFGALLHRAGYYVAAAGKWHMGDAAAKTFDTVRQKPNTWLETLQNRPKDRPFCLWVGFFDAHRPFDPHAASPAHSPEDAVVPPFLPDFTETRSELAAYYDQISRMDGEIGHLLQELDHQGVAKNTVVIFLGDNGRPFPRCKTTVYDSGLDTPLIIRWPRMIAAGTTCDALVSTVDLAPTVIELAGLPLPNAFQGRSIARLFRDPNATIRDAIFAERNWHDFDDYGRCVRTNGWKYIHNLYTDVPATPPADIIRGATYQEMRRLRAQQLLQPRQQRCFNVPRPSEELYDLTADPNEERNLAADSANAKTLADLRATLARWMKETDDFVPAKRRPDGFDRKTGRPIAPKKVPTAPLIPQKQSVTIAPDAGARKPTRRDASGFSNTVR